MNEPTPDTTTVGAEPEVESGDVTGLRPLPEVEAPSVEQNETSAADSESPEEAADSHASDSEATADPHGLMQRLEDLVKREEELLQSTQLQLVERQRRVKTILEEWKQLGDISSRKLQKLKDRFSQLTSELMNEMEWERWSNSKRKETLCEQAHALLSETDGEIVAEKVKLIQLQWKEIGPSFREDEKLWKRFKEDCDKAFETAKAYFRKCDEERAVVAVKKAELLVELEQAAANDNLKQATPLIKDIQERWSKLGPATRELQRDLEKRYAKICNDFFKQRREHFAQQDSEREENLNLREALCEKAEHWVAKNDWQRALPDIKKLQQEWKSLGPAPQKSAKAVWERFTQACDKIYAPQKEQNQQVHGELVANHEAKLKLCGELEALVNQNDLDAAQKQSEELERQFRQAGPSPRELRHEENRRFSAALRALADKHQQRIEQRQLQRRDISHSKAALCLECESLLENDDWSGAKVQLPDLRQRFKSAGSASLEKELKKRFERCSQWIEQGRQKAQTEVAKQHKVQLERMKHVCFQMERLAGIEPSETDESTQRQWMVAELASKMGRSNASKRSKADEARDLADEWLEIGPVPSGQREPLQQRFDKAQTVFPG